VKNYGVLIFAVLIAVIGAVMMTVTSSPSMKGAAFLWLPAALQLIAGVWFGPVRGFIAGAVGAYAAGILAYGGWGLTDIIMNPIAGGFANSMLPGLLFMLFKIDPSLGAHPTDVRKGILRIGILLVLVLAVAIGLKNFNLGPLGYLPPFVILAVGPLILGHLEIRKRDLILAFLIALFSCALSALIGSFGAVVGGQSWKGAIVGVGVGWFLGDTISALLGLYMLAALTDRAREAGLCD
jgi:hypothetical protein